jgi:cell division protein FtsI/penicillin-binding protein 2
VDPSNGRILTIVNQKLAFESYQPCSTFKPAIALAALEEGLIENDKTRLQLGRRWYLDLTRSLTISNNLYFEKLGGLLGLEKMRDYARRFGFGELSSWGLPDEPRGALPTKAPPATRGGVGRIASFGEGIEQTLLQQASFMSAVSNGGTLFYLQYPLEEGPFEPLVKRRLEIGPWLAPVREGLEEAVVQGTARSAKQPDVTILGKTGTCRQNGARLGWFAGYSQEEGGLAIAVLLRGGRSNGPEAARLAGRFYRNLADQHYVAQSVHDAVKIAPPVAVQLTPLR